MKIMKSILKNIAYLKNPFIKERETYHEVSTRALNSIKGVPSYAIVVYDGYTTYPDFTVVHSNILDGVNGKEIGKINTYEGFRLVIVKFAGKEIRLERENNGKFKPVNV